MALSAGTVSIGVKPDTAQFGSSLKSQIMGHTAGIGEGMGSAIMGGLKMFAGPIAAVTAAFSVKHLVDDSVKAFEDLASSVKGIQRVSGGTVEEVSGLRGAMQLAGVDVNTAGAAITKFSVNLGKAGADAGKTAAMSKLFGESIKDSNGHVKSMAELLPGLSDKFKEMPNGAEKTALAVQLFGKQGAALIPVLNKGSEGIAELTGKAKDMGLVLDDAAMKNFSAAKESARNFNAAIQGVKVTLGGSLLPVLDAFQNIMRNAITPLLLGVTKFLGEHREAFQKVAEAVDAFGKKANDGLGSFFKGIMEAFKPLGPVFASLVPQLMQLSAAFSPVRLIFEALKPVLPAIIDTVVQLAVSLGTTLGNVLKQLLPPINEVVKVLVGTLSDIFKQLMPAIMDLSKAFGQYLGEVVKQLAPVIVMLVQAVASLIPPLVPLIAQIIKLAIDAIVPLAKAIMPLILTLLPVLVDLIKMLMPVVTFLAQVIENILVVAIQVAINILKVIVTVVTNVIKWFSDMVVAVVNTGKKIGEFFSSLGNNVKNMVGDAGTWLLDAGKNIIEGLINGASSMGAAVSNWVRSLGSSIVNGFKSMLGIHSPSTVFHGFGENLGQGLANGIETMIDPVTGMISSMGSAVASEMDTVVQGLNGNLIDITAMVNKRNSELANLKDAGYTQAAAQAGVNAANGGTFQSVLDKQLGQATFTNSATGMSTTMGGDLSTVGAQQSAAALIAKGYTQTSGTTIVYNAAPNASISAEAALVSAIQRAKVLGGL